MACFNIVLVTESVYLVECVGEHLTYLSKLTPSWMTLITIKKKRYVKLDKRRSVKAVLETIQQAENELKH